MSRLSDDVAEEKKEEYFTKAQEGVGQPAKGMAKHFPAEQQVDDSKPSNTFARASSSVSSTKCKNTLPIESTSKGNKIGRIFLSLLSLSAHSILFLCFLGLAAAYCLRSIHDDYFVPVVERATRRDDDLLDEVTYYERHCNAFDVSAGVEDAQDLFIQPDSKNYGVDQMMTHGSVLFPNVLSSTTVEELRKFIVAKNAAVSGTPAEYPVSQGKNRISYGIEATEDPAVVRALKEMHGNRELQHLLEGLLGENPALTEITAITAKYGAPSQAWHPDVKPDGNGLQFGRTYSHSYSLFIPLQNTTEEMGATDLCPGTHYCATPNLSTICEEEKIGMHQVSGHGFWPAGSAALFNQQVWHRGTKHTDRKAQDRVVFIVSFLARPNDTRQLSRGTYFHMKWNMWGHTWADLADPMSFMSWPWNILTCLHIWRPHANGWGYDLITAAAMRIGNNQLGCEPADLQNFLDRLDRLGFPEWLDGTIDMDRYDAWQVYIRETISNIWNFMLKVNIVLLGAYILALGTALVLPFQRKSAVWRSLRTIVLTHGMIIIAATYVLSYVRRQPYAKNITEGRMLMRPFPPVEATLYYDPSIPMGPTAFPHRTDVLFGGRLDAKTIGAYNRWLEFHPGNQIFLEQIEAFGGASVYRSYSKDLPPAFARAVLDATMEGILESGGRFLQQDYRTGDWMVMSPHARDSVVKKMLYIGPEGPLWYLKQELRFILSETRFNSLRETSMSRTSLLFLHDLDVKLFHRSTSDQVKYVQSNVQQHRAPYLINHPFLKMPANKITLHNRSRNWINRWTKKPLSNDEFVIGEEVLCGFKQQGKEELIQIQATITDIDEDGLFCDIALYQSDARRHRASEIRVRMEAIEKLPTLQEGSLVWANYLEKDEWFPGVIKLLWPNGCADIHFVDGDEEAGVLQKNYKPRF